MKRHKSKYFFKNEDLDFYFAWMLSYSSELGATMGECFSTASNINDKKPETWVQAWLETAKNVELKAKEMLKNRHHISAKEAFLRAFTYYRAASIGLRYRDPRFHEVWQKLKSCFQEAGKLINPPIEFITIPFEGFSLSGYFMHVNNKSEKLPTLIMVGGGETFAEDLYFWIGAAGVRRDYQVLFVDLPGQGGNPLRNLFMKADAEVPIKAVIDYALNRPDVDPNKLALFGISFGGYLVTRTAVHDPRIKALIANTPIIDAYDVLMAIYPSIVKKAPGLVEFFLNLPFFKNSFLKLTYNKNLWQVGAKNISEGLEILKNFTIEGLIKNIQCPTLCLMGTSEAEELKNQTRRFYEELHVEKKIIEFTVEEGADAHCSIHNIPLMQQVVFDWLDGIFNKI